MIRAAKTERDLDLVLPQPHLLPVPRICLHAPPQRRRRGPPHRCGEPVSTLGSMQVSAAFVIARWRRRRTAVSASAPSGSFATSSTRARAAWLWHAHAARLSRPSNPSRLFVFADYNAGATPAATRPSTHGGEAQRGGTRTGRRLMLYDAGKPKPDASATERALRSLKLADTGAHCAPTCC